MSNEAMVEVGVRFLADVVVHELRESVFFDGYRVFDPHYRNEIDLDPPWLWTDASGRPIRDRRDLPHPGRVRPASAAERLLRYLERRPCSVLLDQRLRQS